MALNRSTIRTDLGYLSRRRKATKQPETTQPQTAQQRTAQQRTAQPQTAQQRTTRPVAAGVVTAAGPVTASPAAPGSGGLTLLPGSSGPGPASKPRMAASERLFPAPAFGGVRQLGEANPLVRLNARQSAIGSLLVTGARSVAWEDRHLTTGAHHADGHLAGTPVSTPGNRPLVGIQDSSGVVSLRHVRLLRRALFIAGEAPLTIGVFDGAAAAVAPRDEGGLRSVLYVSRFGAVLELRAESVPLDASDATVWAIFGFTMTIPLDQRVLRR
jgi:hypothetical protein